MLNLKNTYRTQLNLINEFNIKLHSLEIKKYLLNIINIITNNNFIFYGKEIKHYLPSNNSLVISTDLNNKDTMYCSYRKFNQIL